MSTIGPHHTGSAEDLLRHWIGLDPATVGSAAIQRAVRTRMAAIGIADPGAFAERARQDDAERDRLVEEVVVAESWFFRDRQVFDFVRRFACTLAALPGRVPVRILSAPCAAGEEPYSIAMHLLDAGLAPTQFAIDAIDVSRVALDRAQRARFTANAFRNADLSFRDRWFHAEQGDSVLDGRVCDCVRFAWGNLLEESFVTASLAAGRAPYDIVFCRNLLIYLTPSARGQIERSLERLLKPDGLLVLGSAEPPIMRGNWIPAGDSSIFALRRGPAGSATAAAASPPRRNRPPSNGRQRAAGVSRPAAAAPAETGPAGGIASETAAASSRTLEDVLREAGAMANARRFADAIALCEEHVRRLGPSPDLFFLLGMLQQSAGDLDRAEGFFHKTLYLDAAHEEAILSLALLAAQRGDAAMAEKYRRSAARIVARKASS